MAPGNGNRSGGYPALASRHDLPYALIETARQTVRFILNYGSYPPLWLGGFAASMWTARLFPGVCGWMRRPANASAALLFLVAVLFLTLFPVYWEYGEMNYSGEGRTYNVSYLALCVMVLVVTGSIARALPGSRGAAAVRTQARIELVLAGLLAVFLIGSPSTRQVFEALRGAPAYLAEERARAHDLQRAPREGVVFVDRISARPAGLFWGDVEPDQSHWINICVARYYGLQFVRTRM
jgi:hypothetical protein